MKNIVKIVLLFAVPFLIGGCVAVERKCEVSPFAPGAVISLEECLKYLRNGKRSAEFRKNYFALAEIQQQFRAAQKGFAEVQPLLHPGVSDRYHALRKRLIDLTAQQQELVLALHKAMGFISEEGFAVAFTLPETLPDAELPGIVEMEKQMAIHLKKQGVAPSNLEMTAKLRMLYTRYLHRFELCRHYHKVFSETPDVKDANVILRNTEARMEFIRARYELYYICRQIKALTGIR